MKENSFWFFNVRFRSYTIDGVEDVKIAHWGKQGELSSSLLGIARFVIVDYVIQMSKRAM